MTIKTFFPACLSLALFACSKHSNAPTTPKDSSATKQTNVYCVGTYADDTTLLRACYWKNDSLALLPGGGYSGANAIALAGSDLYIAGVLNNQPVYWKNGSLVSLSHGLAQEQATAICVNGPNVYVAGQGSDTAFSNNPIAWYCVNGQLTLLSSDTCTTFVNGMAVSGGNVYVVGFQTTPSNPRAVAKCWVNGIATNLTDGTRSSTATGIYISGTDIYITGQVSDVAGMHYMATYWKNGIPVTLSDSSGLDAALGISVSGSDVYVSGTTQTGNVNSKTSDLIGAYWKNGTYTQLSDGTLDCHIENLALSGQDVYIAYYSYSHNGFAVPTYFKNGQSTTLYQETTATSYVNTILVATQ